MWYTWSRRCIQDFGWKEDHFEDLDVDCSIIGGLEL